MNRESSLQIDYGMKDEKKNAATGFDHHQIDQKKPTKTLNDFWLCGSRILAM